MNLYAPWQLQHSRFEQSFSYLKVVKTVDVERPLFGNYQNAVRSDIKFVD
jgi:hypothetical protein